MKVRSLIIVSFLLLFVTSLLVTSSATGNVRYPKNRVWARSLELTPIVERLHPLNQDNVGVQPFSNEKTASCAFVIAKETDNATGHTYFGMRYYDKITSRFNSHDPLEGNEFEPITLNRYVYGNSNPLKYFDFMGFRSLTQNEKELFDKAYGLYPYPDFINAVKRLEKAIVALPQALLNKDPWNVALGKKKLATHVSRKDQSYDKYTVVRDYGFSYWAKYHALGISSEHDESLKRNNIGLYVGSNNDNVENWSTKGCTRIDCITYLMLTLKNAYAELGYESKYVKIRSEIKGLTGVNLFKSLSRNEWKTTYFMRDVGAIEDLRDVNISTRWNLYPTVKKELRDVKKGKVHGIRIDETMLDFLPVPKVSNTFITTKKPKSEVLKQLGQLMDKDFALGFYAAGYHTWMIVNGKVLEAHYSEPGDSSKLFTEKDFLEFIEFSKFRYSGVITYPPD